VPETEKIVRESRITGRSLKTGTINLRIEILQRFLSCAG
jgi:hypothetical protein